MAWQHCDRASVVLLAVWMTAWLTSGTVRGSDQEKLPKPEVVELISKDGVQLKATYYGQREGSKAVPVILLHDYKSNRNAFADLCKVCSSGVTRSSRPICAAMARRRE